VGGCFGAPMLRNLPLVCHLSTPQLSHHPRIALSATEPGKYGTKEYWDSMYTGVGRAAADGLPADAYSWYCSWDVLEPFWSELVPSCSCRVLVPGVGNDATIPHLYDAGYHELTAFDYSPHAVERAAELFGERDIALLCADATQLPLPSASFDAVLDKGALDSIGIHSLESLAAAVDELARTTAAGGVVVSISRALEAEEIRAPFSPSEWDVLRDGGLHITEDGIVSTDLSANLFAWRRR